MRTVERYGFSVMRFKLDVTVAIMVTDDCVDSQQRFNAIQAAVNKTVSRHVERRVDALREDLEKHDASTISRDLEKDIDMHSAKILRRVASEIAETLSDMCEASGDQVPDYLKHIDATPGFLGVNIDSITLEAQPIVEGGAHSVVEVEVSL